MFERAAQLSPPGDERAGRLMHAANLGLPAGNPRAGLPLLERVLTETADCDLRPAVHASAAAGSRCGPASPFLARDGLLDQARPGRGALDPDLGGDDARPCRPDLRERSATRACRSGARPAAVRAGLRPARTRWTMPILVVALAGSWPSAVTSRRGPLAAGHAATPHLRGARPAGRRPAAAGGGPGLRLRGGGAEAHSSLSSARHVRRARRRAVGLLPFQLSWLALARWRDGDWARAWSTAHDARSIFADEAGWPDGAAQLPRRARDDRGHARPGRGLPARTPRRRSGSAPAQTGVGVIEARAAKRLALLAWAPATPRTRRAPRAGWPRSRPSRGLGDTVLFNWAGDQVEALVQAGEPDRACTRRWRCWWPRPSAPGGRPSGPLAARCRGLLAGPTRPHGALDELASALHWHAQAAQPVRGGTHPALVHGQLLRRFRRRAKARAAADHRARRLRAGWGRRPWADRTPRPSCAATGLQVGRRGVPEQPSG